MNYETFLIKNKFNVGTCGFDYWLDFLKELENINILDYEMENFYKQEGEKYQKHHDTIERSMRYAAKPAAIYLKRKYGMDDIHLSTKKLVFFIARIIKLEQENYANEQKCIDKNEKDSKIEKAKNKIKKTIEFLETCYNEYGKSNCDFCIGVLEDVLKEIDDE